MSFMGKVRTSDPTPEDVKGVRRDFGSALRGQIPGALSPIGDYSSNADMQFFLNNLLKPYSDLFSAQRGSALAQAKESAGNLTGSGYNNILGSAAAESIGQEQFILANLLNSLRGQEINRGLTLRGQDIGWQSNLLNTILGFGSSGWAKQQQYQPGFIDYAAPIAGTVIGGMIGGPAGAAAGSQVGGGYGSPDYRP